ncbi:tetratricopeptide repeat protein [Neisseria cinerea]|uniref:tetratricopeptide repeat protein n=1 Tax=Neisseria cinerea TaxID=483 RepID=UPI0027DF5CC1|nr:23S rRNA methyltransferase [Neisseria cinerea]
MENSLIIGLALVAVLLVLLVMRAKQGKQIPKHKSQSGGNSKGQSSDHDDTDWIGQVDRSVSDGAQSDWSWNESAETASAAVSAQEVDPLTEYQVYKQFGYQGKAAESLAAYLNSIPDDEDKPENLIRELLDTNLEVGDVDVLADNLQKYGSLIPSGFLAKYVQQALQLDPNHLRIRVLAEEGLGWSIQEIEKYTEDGAVTADSASALPDAAVQEREAGEVKRIPIVRGKKDVSEISQEEVGAIAGLVRADQGAKILKGKVSYETASKQYDRAIQASEKPANLIIDALKLDYQHADIDRFAGHLWKLYQALGNYGRQVKERMLGWGYSLGYHEVFDDLEKGPDDQQIKDIGMGHGYLPQNIQKSKAQYRDLVLQDSSLINTNVSPADDAIKEVESLLMYGQLDAAIDVLEQAVLKYPDESQLYITLIDIYERTEDWDRLGQFLRVLRERADRLPEEVVMLMSRLLQRMNRNIKK